MKRRNNLASTGQASLSHVDHLTSNIIPATEKKSEESVSADVLKMLNMREQLSELQQQPINDARIAEIKAAVRNKSCCLCEVLCCVNNCYRIMNP